MAFLLPCSAGWLFAFGALVLALESGGLVQRLVYGVVPLVASGVVVVRVCRRGLIRRVALLLAACATDYLLYHALRGEPDRGLRVTLGEADGLFSWGPAAVRFPLGFRYKKEHGMDTLIGRFRSPDGLTVIRHDIGEYAGEQAGAGGVESLRDGARVRVAPGGVAFPDSGCAIFYLEADSAEGRAVIDSISRSFKPAAANWLRPILPELLRSDCRSRFRILFA